MVLHIPKKIKINHLECVLGTASQKQSLEIIALPSLDNSPSCLSVPQTSEKWYTPSKGLSLTLPLQCCPFLHPTFCQVLKVQRVYDFFSWVICPWCCNHSSEVSCVFSRLQQQYAVMWDEAWTLLSVCASLFFCLQQLWSQQGAFSCSTVYTAS